MSEKKNLKQRINDGEVVIGAAVPLTATRERLEEVIKEYPYDYFALDSQHSAFCEHDLVNVCNIAAELEVDVQFRIKHTKFSFMLGNYLDLGPTALEIPQVEDESTVQEALDSFYLPPVGKRSWLGGESLGFKTFGEGKNLSETEHRLGYSNWWNKTGVLWMQIESINAVTNAAKFAKKGVDCLSWGPADLSFSREDNPNHPFKTDDDCVNYVAEQLKGTETKLAIRHYYPELRDKYIKMGATVLLEIPK